MVAHLFLEEAVEDDGETSSEWSYVNTKTYGYLQIGINNTDGNVLGTNFYGLYGRLFH